MDLQEFKTKKSIIGIDEVGRGPLAGKITVCALLLSKEKERKLKKIVSAPLRDSKKLSVFQREEWFKNIKKEKINFVVSSASEKIIDRMNISRACNLSATRAFFKLIEKTKIKKVLVIADGSIKINNFPQNKNFIFKHFSKADEKIPAVSLASIVAKVTRDAYMVKEDKKYPQYGFKDHKGYGTKKHIKAIKKYGPSKLHRLTFIKKFHKIDKS